MEGQLEDGCCQVEQGSALSRGQIDFAEPADRSPYRGYRLSPEIIAHAVWLYFRFHLSFRDVQDLLAERGVVVSHETIRQWCTKFGGRLRRRTTSTTRASWRQVASGRGGAEDPWQTPLAVASRRSARSCTGHPGPGASRSSSRRAVPASSA